jgi:GNAT superfamily N-acetyltransferase
MGEKTDTETIAGERRIVAEHANSEASTAQLEKALYDFNGTSTGMTAWEPLLFCVRDAAGTLEGGLSGYLWGGFLHITILWLDEKVRGLGFGGALLAAAEEFARQRDHHDVYLSTFDFQAPEFYRKHGYRCFGELPDYPRGHTHYFMHKRLPPAVSEAQSTSAL